MSLPWSPVPDSELHDLHRRIASTRYATLPSGTGWQRGTDPDTLARLLAYWRDGYDWRRHEARLRGLPWERVGSGDQSLTVVHRRAAWADAPVVVLLHGWPDSVLRFERLLPLLEAHVVVPALPGFPFGGAAVGLSVKVMAERIAAALATLGYSRYVISAGDVGADIAEHLAAAYPDRVQALHLTNISPLHAVFVDRSTLDAPGLEYLDKVALWQRKEGGYIAQQSTKPHSLAPGLADSPAGLAAWLLEKLQGWSDKPFDDDDLLTWISAYWFTGTIGSSMGPYVEFAPPVPYVSTPTVLSRFAHDTKPAPVEFARRFVAVHEAIEHDEGGHFAAWEQPHLYADDVRRALALADLHPREAR